MALAASDLVCAQAALPWLRSTLARNDSGRPVAGNVVGQRHGLGISADRRLYVLRLDPRAQQVIVGDVTDLDCSGAWVDQVNWIAGVAPEKPIRARVQIRHRHQAALALVEPTDGGRARIRFEDPVRAVAPGQAAVFYDSENDEELLGGGWLVEGSR